MAEFPLITTIALSIVLAFVFGYIAKLLKLPSILGYLIAGISIGPYTPGIVADQDIAKQLAEIGIILLMFGVGLHFSLQDLMRVKRIAIPGALFQMISATIIGILYLMHRNYGITEAVIFGLSLSVASTVVLLRALELRNELEKDVGRIAIGWLIVEDIAMVFAIVLLPAMAESALAGNGVNWGESAQIIGITLVKIAALAVLMVVLGRRFLPMLLVRVARQKSRELSSLCTLAIALGFAYLAYVAFGTSFALGAFLAGMVLNGSEIGYKAAEQSLPLRDTFAVLFFVAIGMLFNPMVLVNDTIGVLAVFFIITIGKSLAALLITHWFKQPWSISKTVAVSLAQIGEFSFIFAGMAKAMGFLSQQPYDLILAGALLSIAVNPFFFRILDWLAPHAKTPAKKRG